MSHLRSIFLLPILNIQAHLYTKILRLHLDPENATFLSEAEKQAILEDVPAQAPSMTTKTLDLGQIKALFKSPTFVPFLVIWITHGIGGFGITFILPNVICK